MLLVVGKFQVIRDNVFNEYWDLTRFEFYCIQQDSILWPKLILSTQSKLCEIHLGGEQAPPLVCPPPRIVRQVCNKVFGLGDQTRCLLKTKVWVVNRVITRDTLITMQGQCPRMKRPLHWIFEAPSNIHVPLSLPITVNYSDIEPQSGVHLIAAPKPVEPHSKLHGV